MWPFKCQKIKHRQKRMQSRIEMVEYKANEVRKKYFVLEGCFGVADDNYRCNYTSQLFSYLDKYKFMIGVECFYFNRSFIFYTNEELIFNKVKELINEYNDYENQLRKLHKFLEILN